jgi:LuxR family maltose regulon positive regulatory protein
LVELRQADLRFTPEEAGALLERGTHRDLSAEQINALTLRTEGWVVGLQMMALSLRGKADLYAAERAPSVATLSGRQEHVADYMTDEVLDLQPEEVRRFLLQTSILRRLSGALCDAVCAAGDPGAGQRMLERLQGENLFIVPLDDERRWYRYHQLFADLLRQRVQYSQPDLVSELHRRAGAWYADNGLPEEAIEHALDAHDLAWAAELIERCVEATLMRGEVATFLSWVDRLPAATVHARPSLRLCSAWASLLANRPIEAIEPLLQELGADAATASGGASLRSFVATFQGKALEADRLSRQALRQSPAGLRFSRDFAALNIGLCHVIRGDLEAAVRVFQEAARLGRKSGNLVIAVYALCQLAEQRAAQGRRQEAMATYEQALALAVDREGKRLPAASLALIGIGELRREWDDLDTAAQCLEQGIALAQQWAEIGCIDGCIALAYVKQAQGEAKAALDLMHQAQDIAARSEFTDLDDAMVCTHLARLLAMQGNVRAAAQALERCARLADGGPAEGHAHAGPYFLRERQSLARIRLLIVQQEPVQALERVQVLRGEAEALQRVSALIEMAVLEALACQLLENVPRALRALERALSLAAPGGYVRIFADEGLPMARLLYKAVEKRIAAPYPSRLLAAFPDATPPAQPHDGASRLEEELGVPMVEALTKREVQVLQLVADGLSNAEIAQRLYISRGTVKTHTRNIYGKLGVHNRVQAVARATTLGILSRGDPQIPPTYHRG